MTLFWHQLRAEQLAFWRSRESAIFVFLFPPLLFVLLASIFGDEVEDGEPVIDELAGGLVGYAVANTALAGLAITLVIRREHGLLKRLRSTPLPAPLYLATTLLSSLTVVALQSLAIVAIGVGLYDADLPEAPLSFLAALALGGIAFAGLGLAAAALIRSADAVAAAVNLVVLPMAFLSGSFGDTDDQPRVLQLLADVLPLRYLIDLVVAAYVGGEPPWEHLRNVAVVALWGAAGYAVAVRRFGWEPRER